MQAILGAGGDTNRICSATKTYLDCLNEFVTDCNLDSISTVLSQTIAGAKQTLSQYGCGGGADAQNCSPSKITTCLTNYNSAIAGAGEDTNTFCSAANTYLDCLNEVHINCNFDSGITSLGQTIAGAKQTLSQYGCGGGADAQNCSPSKITRCLINYVSAIAAGAGKDKTTLCSAGNTYMDCLNDVVTDCNLDSGSTLSQTIAAAKQTLSQYSCGRCAANTYLDCLNEIVTNCNLDSGSTFLNQTIAAAKHTRSQYGCGGANGAGSLVFNLVAIVSGLTFYKLF
ncbi:Hypothetical predicted protein [Mytilus galloprovincialis]|uniref:Uncharacterized protein n=1 Tax=Mytilus galloprovincialis TaxID=29158 RepID=A0A8B6EDW8_MYTGA|nr:Hypothetical predicted protein [Mytilus galloprovincialis]